MHLFFYNLVIRSYALMIRLSAFRNPKARMWVKGRKNWEPRLREQIKGLGGAPLIWMHCASYGEFEQGRPLLEAIRQRYPGYKILLTFFSPSGYEAFKGWPGAELVSYLPFDSANNAARFLDSVRPKLAIFIKYEFWLNFLFALKQAAVPTYLVSAVFKPHHPFFRWYGKKFRESLNCYHRIFVQDLQSYRRISALGVDHARVTGDTRFDRVLQIRENFSPLPFFENYCKGQEVLIAGSTWPGDDELLLRTFLSLRGKNRKLILVPHETEEKQMLKLMEKAIAIGLRAERLSLAETNPQAESPEVLVVDRMGILARLYHYASITYVGGGFNEGLHNCLEPAVYLKPVFFYGEYFYKYNEVIELMEIHAAFKVQDASDFSTQAEAFWAEPKRSQDLQVNLEAYFASHSGSTQKVLEEMAKVLA